MFGGFFNVRILYWEQHLNFSLPNCVMVIRRVSPKVFAAKKMHRGRECLLTQILEQKESTFCFAVYFIFGSMMENQCCRREVSLALASPGAQEEVGRQVQVQNNFSSPTSLAVRFFYRANQVSINVKEILEGEAKSGDHSLRVEYSVLKVRRATSFNLPCVAELLK